MVGLAWQGEMNSKVETQQSALDIFRWVAAAMVLVAAVAVFYTLSEASTLCDFRIVGRVGFGGGHCLVHGDR